MKKKVIVLNQSEGYKFGYDGRDITISESMPVADAEHIQAIHPGLYVEVIEVADEPTDQVTTPAAPKASAKAANPAKTGEVAK